MILLMRFVVAGNSMEPGYKAGQTVLASSLPYLFSKPKLHNVVIAKDPRTNRLLLKRITRITQEGYYIQGDNLKASTDSRKFGIIPKNNIIGKVIYVF